MYELNVNSQQQKNRNKYFTKFEVVHEGFFN